MTASDYPWYTCVEGDEIQQGDILLKCPVLLPPKRLAADKPQEATTVVTPTDVVVVSQTCDLVKDREKLEYVLLCGLWERSELALGQLSKPDGLEKARKGYMSYVHLINSCSIAGFEREPTIVDFRCIYSLPIGFVREFALNARERLRLMPPYREHLSQALARYFMRVGLPVDIPPFK